MSNVIEAVQILSDENGVQYEKHHLGNKLVTINGHQIGLSFHARVYKSGVYVCADHTFASGKQYTFRCRVKFQRDSWTTQQSECKAIAWKELSEKIGAYYPPASSVQTDKNDRQYQDVEIAEFLVNDDAGLGEVAQLDINLRIYGKSATCLVVVRRNLGVVQGAPEQQLIQGLDANTFRKNKDAFLAGLRQQLAARYRIPLA